MDVSEIITTINNHGFDDTDTQEKMLVINDTVWDIESREPWPFLEKTVALNFTGSSPTPSNMPADFNKVLWLYDNVNSVTIWPERLSTIRDRYGNQVSTGQVSNPVYYYFVGSQLRLYPIPPVESTGQYQLDYIATQQELSSSSVEANILLPPRFHRVIAIGAISRLYKLEDDPEQGQMYEADFEARLSRMTEDLFRRQYQRSDQIYVIDEDDEYFQIY